VATEQKGKGEGEILMESTLTGKEEKGHSYLHFQVKTWGTEKYKKKRKDDLNNIPYCHDPIHQRGGEGGSLFASRRGEKKKIRFILSIYKDNCSLFEEEKTRRKFDVLSTWEKGEKKKKLLGYLSA